MSSEPVKRVKRDVIIAIIFGIVLFASLYYLNDPITILDNISVLNSTTTTALGILFTVLAIIYTFESQFENNRAVKILKKQGKYDDISEVFVLSVATIGVIWIFTFTLSITQIYKPFGANITLFFRIPCYSGVSVTYTEIVSVFPNLCFIKQGGKGSRIAFFK